MIRPSNPNHVFTILVAVGILSASSAARAQTTFTLDPARSSLTITNANFTESSSAGTRINGGGILINGNPATPNDASMLTGSYVVANGVATLTIPIDATYTSTSSNLGGQGMATVVTEVVGTFVAMANVPEPST